MSLFDKLKTVVTRGVAGRASNALAPLGGAAGTAPSLRDALQQAMSMTSKLFEEREWQCPCGHRFRAPGEWVACAPIYCEVPSCPNPKYYVDGPGRALIEANPGGVKLHEVTSGSLSSATTSARKDSEDMASAAATTRASSLGGVGSRFK